MIILQSKKGQELHVSDLFLFHTTALVALCPLARSLSGKNWQDRDKADKVSISFPSTPNDKLNVFVDVMKYSKSLSSRGGG